MKGKRWKRWTKNQRENRKSSALNSLSLEILAISHLPLPLTLPIPCRVKQKKMENKTTQERENENTKKWISEARKCEKLVKISCAQNRFRSKSQSNPRPPLGFRKRMLKRSSRSVAIENRDGYQWGNGVSNWILTSMRWLSTIPRFRSRSCKFGALEVS